MALMTGEQYLDSMRKLNMQIYMFGEKIENFDIEIDRVNNNDTKNIHFKITSPELIDKTGGVVQGMSGSPIIQNGKFVGAVTHVLVNDPTIGYGVFADIMLKQMKEVE